MHNPKPVQKNEKHKALWDSDRQPDLVIVNKKDRICWIVDFAVPADHSKNFKKAKRKIST